MARRDHAVTARVADRRHLTATGIRPGRSPYASRSARLPADHRDRRPADRGGVGVGRRDRGFPANRSGRGRAAQRLARACRSWQTRGRSSSASSARNRTRQTSSASAFAATPSSTPKITSASSSVRSRTAGRATSLRSIRAGARYDALINPGGESDNPDWDGIWEAATARTADRLERRDPHSGPDHRVQSGLHEWQFNVQRRIQRRLETDRWASPNRQYQITQTSQAGLLHRPPGLRSRRRADRPAGGHRRRRHSGARRRASTATFQPSLDISQRIGANVLASATVNTDFAETEVDTRRTNLTRFPLFFPEKRTFFIEGDDIFSFGLGLEPGRDSVFQPAHRPDRRIARCRFSPAAR